MDSKKRANQILSKVKKAQTKRQLKDPTWQLLDAYDRNEQHLMENTNIPPWIPRPHTNFIHLVKYTKRAALAMENPTGKLRPVSSEDVQRIYELQQAYEFVWEKIKARKVVRQNIETSKLLGTGIAQVYWDETVEGRLGATVLGSEGAFYEGDIRIREIEPSSFFPDPNAFGIEDCQFIAIRERKNEEWIKKHPIFGKGIKEDESLSTENNPQDRGEIYQRDYTVEQDGLVDFTHFYEKKMNANGGFDYSVTYLAGEKIVHHIERLEPNRYPFAILYDFPQRHDFWAKSTCEMILDNQKIINKVESIIALLATLTQNPQKIVNKNSGISSTEVAKYGSAIGHVWVSNMTPDQSMSYMTPPPIPPVLLNVLDNAKANIREITGLTDAYMGNTVGSLQTSSGVESLIERATMRDRDQMYEVEQYIEQLSSLIIDFIITKYKEPRMIRILGEKPEEFQFQTFLGVDYADLEFDFHIDVSAKAPVTRLREVNEAKELLNMQGQYGYAPAIITPQEYMKIAEFTRADQLIKRMNEEEMRNKVEEAMQVANMIAEAQQSGVDEMTIQQMATEMLTQLDEQSSGGMGNTSNSNGFQARQQGAL